MGFAATWLGQVTPPLHMTTLTTECLSNYCVFIYIDSKKYVDHHQDHRSDVISSICRFYYVDSKP